jgi:Mn-containing catalase
VLPIPNFDATKWPEVKKLMDAGVHLKQHHFRLDGSEMGKLFQGASPANDGLEVETTEKPPKGAPIEDLPERPEEFAPGLTPELLEMVEAVKKYK